MWTMDELVERVRLALAAEYPGAPNGRVRDLPDRRAIRWYTTTGLVDRPAGMRGRSAVYGPRHLLQVVAVKRRQAEGHSLAEIQAELAGATDDALADVARVPEPLLATGGPTADDAPARARFWEISRLPDKWTIMTPLASPTAARGAETRTEAPALEGVASAAQGLEPVGGVALPGGVILVTPGMPTADDRAAIEIAARPLLDLLAERGLLTTDGRTSCP